MTRLASTDVMDLLGVPWAAGGRDPTRGLGCYGLVVEIYRRAGLAAPSLWRPATDGSDLPQFCATLLASLSAHWEAIPSPEALALINLPSPWIDGGGHCGVYLADGIVAHAIMSAGVIFEPWVRVAPRARGCYRLRPIVDGGWPYENRPCRYDSARDDSPAPPPWDRLNGGSTVGP